MTTGQRIAQKRKEQGLSQEALGGALGVSRQSVYKWESDNALPEIDKFIAMSRLFGVTIGWLLGVEEPGEAEEAEEKTAPPDAGETELTEAQLKMVEEIVGRYLAAQQPVKKKRWPWALGAAAGLALIMALGSLRLDLRNIRNDYGSLQATISGISRNVDNQIGSIANRVEEVLKTQNGLAVSYEVEIDSADLAANTVTFSVDVTPKTYVDGMTAVFVADNGIERAEASVNAEGGQKFSGQITCGLTDDISISAVFVTGDVRETQLLKRYYDLYLESLPDDMWPEGDMDRITLNGDGELWWPGYKCIAYLPNASRAYSAAYYGIIGRAEVKSLRVGLFRNRKLLGWLEPCEQPEYYRGVWNVNFYSFPEVSVTPREGDVFQLCTIAEDEYGRVLVYQGMPYVLNRDAGGLVMADNVEIGMDRGPEDWEY